MKRITVELAIMCLLLVNVIGCSSGGSSSSIGASYSGYSQNTAQNPYQNPTESPQGTPSRPNPTASPTDNPTVPQNPTGTQDGVQKIYALFAGINSTILGSENDATELRAALSSGAANTVWNNSESILFLTSQTTKSNITAKISEFSGKADGDDIFLFYYSGHGSGGNIKPSGGNISASELSGYLSKFPSQTKKIVILDCCDSGLVINSLKNISNITILAATKSSGIEDAQEGSLSSSYLGSDVTQYHYGHHHGYFTYFLIRGLGRDGSLLGEVPNSGTITVQSLFNYASSKMKDYSNYLGIPQNPTLYTNTADFIIKGR